jgi:putative nucleotidyltransferase with HDIG domain
MEKLSLEELESKVRALPALSPVACDALACIDHGDTNDALTRILVQDPGLTSRLLKLANSSFYGLSGRVGSVREALMVLGLATVRNMVLACAVMEKLPGDRCDVIDGQGLWQHALGTGVAARLLARQAGLEPELAFTAGLLHDMGKLVLALYFPEPYRAVLRHQAAEGCLIQEAEQAVLGLDHADVGACVARRWRLPATLADAIAWHHRLQEGTPRLADLIHVADVLSRDSAIGSPGDPIKPALNDAALRRLALKPADIEAVKPLIAQHAGDASVW